jgi:trehalose synthase
LSPKNVELSHRDVTGILTAAGIVAPTSEQPHGSPRTDGSLARVRSPAGLTEVNATPSNASIVVQVSRWDALKDPLGVMDGFAEWVRRGDTHLILAGPTPSSVDDDPEASDVLAQVRQRWSGLPDQVKWRVHLANLAVDDPSENAIVVNALQRRSDVLVQKSLAEGFGLTVTEAMWKMRPVVGSRVGGIQEQIEDGLNGLLVDPRDLGAFGSAVTTLLDDPVHAASLGVEGRRRVEERFLPTHYLAAYLQLFLELLGEDRG